MTPICGDPQTIPVFGHVQDDPDVAIALLESVEEQVGISHIGEMAVDALDPRSVDAAGVVGPGIEGPSRGLVCRVRPAHHRAVDRRA